MTRSLLLAFALPLALTLSLAAPAHASDAEGTHPAQSRADVVDIAIGSPDHTTLVAALQAADLVATLKGQGPFTVFAPTNAAFEALPAAPRAARACLRACVLPSCWCRPCCTASASPGWKTT